jgi:long-chain acyl-CoA synthetase
MAPSRACHRGESRSGLRVVADVPAALDQHHRVMSQQPAPAPAALRSVNAATLGEMVLAATERHGGTAITFRRDDVRQSWSYAGFGNAVREVARGLIALGIEPGDRVAVIGNTRPEWTLADCAILAAGAVVVPVYHTNAPKECQYVLENSGARAVVVEDAAQLEKIESIRHDCPELEHLISMEKALDDVLSLDDLRTRALEVNPDVLRERLRGTDPADVATIVYTSGTTGPPKGCLLTHANILATISMYERPLELTGDVVIFLFLPLAHVLARVTQMVALDVGGTLAFWSGNPTRLLEDIVDAHPTHVPTVPRIFEKIHTKALATAQDAGGVQARVFDWAVATGRRARAAERAGGKGRLLAVQHTLADRLVLSKVRALFGDRLQMALSGAAPISGEVLEFFDACGIIVFEGYGLTETCAAATINTPRGWRLGTVGLPLAGTEVRIEEDGEVLLRGPSVFKGYHRNDAATEEIFDGDWLLTGDLGSVDADGFLRITGRKKDLIITSSGKNVTPANIESALRESRWISQAVVHGDNRPYLVALLTLDPEEAPALADQLGITGSPQALADDERVRAALQAEVDAVNQQFARIEQIKSFLVLDHDLTQAAGELTPTLKVKRNVVEDHYGTQLEALYD